MTEEHTWSVYDAVNEAREWLDNKFKIGFGSDTAQDIARDMLWSLDRITEGIKREREEMVSAVRELSDGLCLHCDLQQECADGEDGMPTACNAMTKVRNFLERYDINKETDDEECPF